tara:strand:- start:2181 stop:2672 length:492 start_codon:yes stop_codon:yes gene_type:complete
MSTELELLIKELQDRILTGWKSSNEIEAHRNNLLELAREEIERHPFFFHWGKGVGVGYSEILKHFIFEQSVDVAKNTPTVHGMTQSEVMTCVDIMVEYRILKICAAGFCRMVDGVSARLDRLAVQIDIEQSVVEKYHLGFEARKDEYLLNNAEEILRATGFPG